MNHNFPSKALLMPMMLLLLSACGQSDNDKKDSRPPVRVKTLTVTVDGIQEKCTYSGTVEEDQGTVLSFSTAGTIKSLTVSEGSRVQKGQLIGTLDDGSLHSAYDIAKATLNQARDAYNRMKFLHDSNSLPDIKWVEVQSKLSQAENAVRIARIALDDAKLYAPVSGVVSEKMASVGQTIAPGVPVVKIVDINCVKVDISIPENEITGFSDGMTATITTEANPGKTYVGTLVEKGVSANPLSRSYAVKYRVRNEGGKLLPGMICDVVLNDTGTVEGFVLPVGAVLLSSDNTNFVWLDSANTARKRLVRTGNMLPEGIMIESGLNNGDKVIISGMDKVSQGTKVVAIN